MGDFIIDKSKEELGGILIAEANYIGESVLSESIMSGNVAAKVAYITQFKKFKELTATLKDTFEDNLAFAFLSFPYINSNGESVFSPDIAFKVAYSDISQPSYITRSKVRNNKGTIKEISGEDDFNIKINLLFIKEGEIPLTAYDAYAAKPIEDLVKLYAIRDIHKPIPIYNQYLNSLGIENVVIESISHPEDIQNKNIYNVTINCYSDDANLAVLL